MTNITKVFISFGGPSENYHNSLARISEEANNIKIFDYIHGFTEKDLKNDITFWENHGNFIESNHRGYGYWLWKPYLIKTQLDKLNENDILMYADAGCQINCEGISRLNDYIELLQNNENDYGVIAFDSGHYEYQYTKRKVLEFFGCNREDSKNLKQNHATVIILRKNAHSINLINSWFEVCYNHYELINDETCDESFSFIENRHDQSIWSMTVHKHGAIKLSDETYFTNWESEGNKFPFWSRRLR